MQELETTDIPIQTSSEKTRALTAEEVKKKLREGRFGRGTTAATTFTIRQPAQTESKPTRAPGINATRYGTVNMTSSNLDLSNTTKYVQPLQPQLVKAAIDAASLDPYIIRNAMATGAEAMLYRATCGSFTFCVKCIRNAFSRILGSGLPKGAQGKLSGVSYSTKVRHIRNEYAVGKTLTTSAEDLPVVRILALRPVKRFGIEVGYDLIMEHLSGHDLGDRILAKVLPIDDKIRVLYQAAQALEFIHRKKIIHLDIKPSNFMLVRGRIKLIDFGVSVTKGFHSRSITGTGGYLSPEQLCRETIDERTDIFAFGVTFAVFFGTQPLNQPKDKLTSGATRREAKDRLNKDEVPAIQDIPALRDYPAIAAVLMKCMTPKRESRPANCGILLKQLRLAAEKSNIALEI